MAREKDESDCRIIDTIEVVVPKQKPSDKQASSTTQKPQSTHKQPEGYNDPEPSGSERSDTSESADENTDRVSDVDYTESEQATNPEASLLNQSQGKKGVLNFETLLSATCNKVGSANSAK